MFSQGCVKKFVHTEGHAWRGVCMAGACVTGGHAWQGWHVWQGGMHGRRACVAGGHEWQGACMAGGMHGREVFVAGGHAWQERRPLPRTVRILLECFSLETIEIKDLFTCTAPN